MSALFGGRGGQTLTACIGYVALTIVMTWPIARGMAHDVPADLGDPLLNMWIMAWGAEAFAAMASGTMAFADFWHGNIFHPTSLSLTFSEHLLPQALQGLPVYLVTGNIVLAYNLVFLSTFALSGLGMFLFVRELTGSARAGFIAGLFYAFLPYRLGHFAHIQTLSSQWMPFALFGLRRHFETRRLAALAGGTLAFVVQGLSSGYYLFYFAPVFAAYAVWELAMRRRLADVRAWVGLLVAAAAAFAATWPFLAPYLHAKEAFGFSRTFGEVQEFSADLFSYVNAPSQLWLWGPLLNRYPQPEGDLFLGAVPLALALAAVALWSVRVWRATQGLDPSLHRTAHRLGLSLLGLAVLVLALAVAAIGAGGFSTTVLGLPLRITNARRTLTVALVVAALAFGLSPRLRAAVRARAGDLTPWLLLAFAFSVVMSLGPVPRAGGTRLAARGLYAVFFEWVPGYEGLRAPARFAMVAAVALAPLAGYALAFLVRGGPARLAGLIAIGVLFLGEAYAVPTAMNVNWSSSNRYVAPWPRVFRLNEGPLAYRHLLTMPPETVVLELPFGDHAWDLRYVYYAGLHGKRIVNGYSGYFPDGYRARAARLDGLWRNRGEAWTALTTSSATHLLVHERAYHAPEGAAVVGWLGNMGAQRVADFADGDVLFALPRP